jgi:hypothetical protein
MALGDMSKTTNQAIVLTNCTGRKMHGPGAVAQDLPSGSASVESLALAWRSALLAVDSLHVAKDLYAGRSIREAEAVAACLDAPLYVVSAGLGLISVTDRIPAYDLTVASTGATILPALRRLGASPRHWWTELTRSAGDASPVGTLMRRHSSAVVYVAMPASYLDLIADEVASLPTAERRRLRIVSSPAWQRGAPPELAPFVLPYDERLESTEFAGTRADFPQRALRHFIQALQGHTLGAEDGRAVVAEAMSKQTLKVLPGRKRCTDEEIRSLLRRHWGANDGSGSRLLRVLRDDLLVKCEQTRFRDLWRDVRSEMEHSSP